MASYLKGIGDIATRTNEILPSMDARIYNFLAGHTSGVIENELNRFQAQAIDRGVRVRSGMMQAHGYFGLTDTDTQFNFVMPQALRFVHVYAEINLSVTPHRFELRTTAQSNSAAHTFRQDNLRTNTSGIFRLHLWQVTLNANNTITLTDRRAFTDRPLRAVQASDFLPGGTIEALLAPRHSPPLTGVPTAPTAAQAVNNTQLATTAYVRQAITDVRNITSATIAHNTTLQGVTANSVRRQVNFVHGTFHCTGPADRSGHIDLAQRIATLPSGFRPPTDRTAYGVANNRQGAGWAGAIVDHAYAGRMVIRPNGDIMWNAVTFGRRPPVWRTEAVQGSGMAQSRISASGFFFNFGFEIG